MKSHIRKAVVLGAGNMGAQVAAHLVACGLDVALLDVVPEGATDRNALGKRATEVLKKAKPSPLHLPEHAAALKVGNFEDDWAQLKDADWIFEAVLEDLDIKRKLFAKVAPVVKPTAIVTTNTSGLGIDAMTAELPADLRRRFFGTHFFNPPRYLKLLETIPGTHTDPAVLAAFETFAEEVLGKGVVRCKDTPNFIANRIGMYAMGQALKAMVELDLTIEEVDALTGPAIGRAKSATFRTADIAGVDVVHKVSSNLYELVPNDPEREIYKLPGFVAQMVEKKWLGDKTGSGFYRKEGKEIQTLDWKTLEYREKRKAKFASLEAAQQIADPAERLRAIVFGKDKGAQFLWRVLGSTSLYAASLMPEISDDVVSIDRAMAWGYGWGQGPLQVLDALGVEAVLEKARADGMRIPPLLEQMVASGRKRIYDVTDGRLTAFGPKGAVPVEDRPGVTELPVLRQRGAVRKKNAGASLLDLGDGVALVEFHSKMNSIGADAVLMMNTAVKEAKSNFDALVIGNQGDNFSVGANLMMVLLAVQEEDWDELDNMIRQFQNANMALKYADVPVVAAPFGMCLGGGTEVSLHAHRVRLSAETYMGLVEVGVGLVPGGGGTKEMALRMLDRCAAVEGADPFPFIKRAFDTIAFARVATSGAEAKRLFLTDADSISANPDRLIADAKKVALGLVASGFRSARPRFDVPALGRPALSTFKMGIHNAVRGGQISEHDGLIATHVATILCGGDRNPGLTSEQTLLDLERESFLTLLGTKKSRDRIQFMLKEGKPLRN